jgi:hypothetical protein
MSKDRLKILLKRMWGRLTTPAKPLPNLIDVLELKVEGGSGQASSSPPFTALSAG